MSYMKAGWTTFRTSETVKEILPSHDVIDHKHGFACICKPVVMSDMYNGVVYWDIVHNSFDEYLDEDQTEPYRGL